MIDTGVWIDFFARRDAPHDAVELGSQIPPPSKSDSLGTLIGKLLSRRSPCVTALELTADGGSLGEPLDLLEPEGPIRALDAGLHRRVAVDDGLRVGPLDARLVTWGDFA